MIRSKAVLILILTTCLLFVACNGSKHSSVRGTYNLTKFMYQGWNMAESFTGSNITINGVDDNSSSSITMTGTDSYGALYGHITTETEFDNFIKYKFWVDLIVGDFFDDKTENVYLYYYPQKEVIETVELTILQPKTGTLITCKDPYGYDQSPVPEIVSGSENYSIDTVCVNGIHFDLLIVSCGHKSCAKHLYSVDY